MNLIPVTKEEVLKRNHNHFQHKTELRKNGQPVTVRQNGKVRFWKTRPAEFVIPVKYGLRTCFYITHENSNEWEIIV